MSAHPAPTARYPVLEAIFRFVLAARWFVIGIYVLILPAAGYLATRVGQDNSIERLVVTSDPDYAATKAFQEVFGSGENGFLILEADEPLSQPVVAVLDRLERALGEIPDVQPSSALTAFRRTKGGFEPVPEQVAAFRAFVEGSALLRQQGLVGGGFVALPVGMTVRSEQDRDRVLADIEQALVRSGARAFPIEAVRCVGQPYVTTYLGRATRQSGQRGLGLFLALATVLVLLLYRSVRTLAAFGIGLGACIALSVGYVGLTGGQFTIVSPMVPMTVLITATASFVYIHSRFVERPPEVPLGEHHVFAVANKFVAVTASLFAAAVGFAALIVSSIRPIREMGLWVAVGMLVIWLVSFTLFPALQAVLHTPTAQERRTAAPWFSRFVSWVTRFSFRWRWPLVLASLALSAMGLASLVGVPGLLPPAPMYSNPVDYMSRQALEYRDFQRADQLLPGLSVSQVWLKGKLGTVSEPDVLTALNEFQQTLEADPDIGTVAGVPTLLRMMRYIAGDGDAWPTDPDDLDDLAADLEEGARSEPILRHFVDGASLSQTYLAVISKANDQESTERVDARIRNEWARAVAKAPALRAFEMRIVGSSRLQAKIKQNMVPTLVESFVLTVLIIFCAFVVVFRSGTARIMALIPSVFAIAVMFGVMRATGMVLNVATVLVASTILGASENDQIHFFYHFQERRKTGTVEQSLRHALFISGRAILFASVINAGGFLAFAAADLPPIRDFGILACTALVLAALADFTALPASLWILMRARPDDAVTAEALSAAPEPTEV
ncbi:MAG: MMPL family transporter [Polyangiaceae bacterium]|nr:MMPL family transporter [Polyangiaceae bacterium]